MSTEIALYNDPFEGDFIEKAWGLAARIAKTSFVPDVFRNKPEETLAAILSGREIGIGPMQSLQKINVIKGKPTQGAELMRALVLSKGHEIWTDDYTTTRVTVCGRRMGQEHINTVTWTLDDAKRAKLEGKENWRNYPRAMLLARATGELCRLMFADVLGGISYTPEEVDDGAAWDMGPTVELEPVGDDGAAPADAPKAITRKAAPAKRSAPAKAAAPRSAPASPPLPPLPGEEEPKAPRGHAESEEVRSKRAQQVAMRCNEAGLDDEGRHHLIEAVTNSVKSSSKVVTAEEAAEVVAACREIAAGRKALMKSALGWQLVDVEDATGDFGPDGDPAPALDPLEASSWDGTQWREYLAIKGVGRVEVLREAHRLCAESKEFGAAPGKVEDLQGRDLLVPLLVGFVEDHADPMSEAE